MKIGSEGQAGLLGLRCDIDPDIEPAHPKMGLLLAEVTASAHPLLEAERRVSRITVTYLLGFTSAGPLCL
jgi:hypothetical protein